METPNYKITIDELDEYIGINVINVTIGDKFDYN